MKKTTLGVSFMLTIFVIILMMTNVVFAAGTMTSSSQLVEKIKGYEGFVLYPQKDSSQYSVGYGTVCNAWDYPYGISYAEAERLLVAHIASFEDDVNNFAAKYDINLTQNQFDALVSMTYNLGPGWIKPTTQVWSLLIAGEYTDSQMASAMVAWCNSGGYPLEGLVKRRTDEARMFLYGDYSGYCTNLSRTNFVGNGGSLSDKIMLHPTGEAYGQLATAEMAGFYFLGWYTSDGILVTEADVPVNGRTLYAKWSTTKPEPIPEPEPEIEPTGAFTDVADDAWYAEYANFLVEEGVISGYDDGTFRPQSHVTTGEALKIMMNGMGYTAAPAEDEHWASGFLYTAKAENLVDDQSDLALNEAITREEVVDLAVNMLGLEGEIVASVFADTTSPGANILYGLGVLSGTVSQDGYRYFRPDSTITRAELAKIVTLLMKL